MPVDDTEIDMDGLNDRRDELAQAVRSAAVDVGVGRPRVVRGGTNPHTRWDREVDDRLQKLLDQFMPNVPVLSEERRPGGLGEGLCWVIDPIDGTLNAMVGSTDYAISVALVDQRMPRLRDRVRAAVVYLPNEDILFDAVAGKGARLVTGGGDRRSASTLHVQDARPANSGPDIVAFGIPHDMAEVSDRMAGALRHFMNKNWATRQTGAATIDICRVATGQWRGFFEYRLQYWDFAAAALIAAEAGCTVRATPVGGESVGNLRLVYDLIVARSPKVANTIKDAMNAAESDRLASLSHR